MGVSTDAILFFGALIPDKDEDPYLPYPWDHDEDDEKGETDWQDLLAEKHGVAYPTHLAKLKDWTPEQQDEYRAYSKKRSEIVSALGCRLGSHCSSECPMYYVAVADRVFRAHRGYGVEIEPERMVVPQRDVEKVKRFLIELGYTAEQVEHWRIGWWLVSDWG